MTRRLSFPFAATAVALAVSGLLPVAAQAQQANEGLKWNAAIYGWLPAISGSTAYPVNTGGGGLHLDGKDVLDALKMTFMGTLEVKNGKWGGFTDLVYADLGGSKGGTRDFSLGSNHPLPGDVSADLNLDLKGTIWTTAVTYNIHSSPETSIDLLGCGCGCERQDLPGRGAQMVCALLPGRGNGRQPFHLARHGRRGL